MKSRIFLSFLVLTPLLLVVSFSSAQTDITGYGSSDFNPFDTSTDFQAGWAGSQTTTTLAVSNVSNQSGGIFQSLDISVPLGSNNQISLTGSLDSSTPSTDQFFVSVFDSAFNFQTAGFAWSSFSGAGPLTVTSSLSGGALAGDITSYTLDLAGSPGDTVSFTFENLSLVPEPSTAFLTLFGLGLLSLRRCRK